MNVKIKMFAVCTVWIFAAAGFSDTFKNKATGDVFHGFMTQKSSGSKTLVYNEAEKKLLTINLEEYEVVYDTQGRRETVIVVPITKSEILLSQNAAEMVAASIIDASNKGPQAIVVQIDSPGGRADYMKIITSAIMNTQNCQVFAYITGTDYGGAFSTAAMIAMACEKVYIAPTASMGSVSLFSDPAMTDDDYAGYLSVYCPYVTDYKIIAEYRKRPLLLVEALVNRSVSVMEVTNLDGSRAFIQTDQRQPTQTVVRTWAQGVSASGDQKLSQADVVKASLHLTAAEAVEVGLADKVVHSLNDLLVEMNLPKAQLTNVSGIDNVIKKYSVARRNIAESLAFIQQLEQRSELLDGQLTEIEKQLTTGTVTQHVTQARIRSNRRLPNGYESYYYDPLSVTVGGVALQGSRNRSSDWRNRAPETVTVTSEVPAASYEDVRAELLTVLDSLIAEYKRVITLAKRWPGGLPPEIPLTTLEKNRTDAESSRAVILNKPVYESPLNQPMYEPQRAPRQVPGNYRNRRNGY